MSARACADEAVRFSGIHTRLGVSVSGGLESNCGSVVLSAGRGCETRLNGLRIVMEKGETKRFSLRKE